MPDLPYSTYDPQADALYFYLTHEEIVETVEVLPTQLMVDLDDLDLPVGVEILGPNFPHGEGEWVWLSTLTESELRFIANVVRRHHHEAGLEDHPGNLANELLAVIEGC